jgi:hypothetical protein
MNLHELLTATLIGVASSIVGVAINYVMPNEKILNWWFRFGNKVGIKIVDGSEVERWFYRPIWGCEKCLSGQIAMWYYLFNFGNYSIFCHVVAICTAIISAVFIYQTINKQQQ